MKNMLYKSIFRLSFFYLLTISLLLSPRVGTAQNQPTAICKEIVSASLPTSGCANIPAEVFDNGSYGDNSQIYFLATKYEAGNFNPFDRCFYTSLRYCCEDIGQNQAFLLVLNKDPEPFLTNHTDGLGCTGNEGLFLQPDFGLENLDFCQTVIKIEDTTLPDIISCPSHDTITCEEYYANYKLAYDIDFYAAFDVFGVPVFIDNCPDMDIQINLHENLDHEGGNINRTWQAYDVTGNGPRTCTQIIRIFPTLDPDFIFPPDQSVCSFNGELLGEPTQASTNCAPDDDYNIIYWDQFIMGNNPYEVKRYWEVRHKYTQPASPPDFEHTQTITVYISDVTPPALANCPANQTILCDDYTNDLKATLEQLNGDEAAQSDFLSQFFSTAELEDDCPYLEFDKLVNISLNNCYTGKIDRIWLLDDPTGSLNCLQTILVHSLSDWGVQFPADISANCMDGILDGISPKIFNENCEMIEVSYQDVVSDNQPTSCMKIERTWAVINWCAVGNDIGNEIIEVPENQLNNPFNDLDGDGDSDDRTFRDSWDGIDFPDEDDAGFFAADEGPWDGYIEFVQTIEVTDTEAPTFPNNCSISSICIQDQNCGVEVTFESPDIEDCDSDFMLSVDSDLGSGTGPFIDVPDGVYNVTYTATDLCGNSNTCQTTLEIKDCQNPVANCKNVLTVELVSNNPPIYAFWANELDLGSYDNCSSNLQYSFSSDPDDISFLIGCEDLGELTLNLWVTDHAGNQSTCETLVYIQDSNVDCEKGSDDVAPIIICNENVEIPLVHNGDPGNCTTIQASTFDNGSYDNSNDVYFLIAKKEDSFSDDIFNRCYYPALEFCADEPADIEVYLLVLDGDPSLFFTSFMSNTLGCSGDLGLFLTSGFTALSFNSCLTNAVFCETDSVQLNNCPDYKSIACDLYYDLLEPDLSILQGDPQAQSNFLNPFFDFVDFKYSCSGVSPDLEYDVQISIDDCGYGNILRSWETIPSGNDPPTPLTCQQTIEIHQNSDWVVSFPENATIECSDIIPPTGQPVISAESCEMIATSFKDNVELDTTNGCFQILRTWTAINWCVVGDEIDNEAIEVPENQLASPHDDLDGDGDSDSRTFRDSWNGTDYPDIGSIGQNLPPDTDPDLDPWDGYIEYVQVIYVEDLSIPTFPDGCDFDPICITSPDNCEVSLPAPTADDCVASIDVSVESDLGIGYGPFEDILPGIYSATYTANDNCGNTSTCTTTLEIVDCAPPNALCRDLIVEVTNGIPIVEIFASDFNDGSFDNCSNSLSFLIELVDSQGQTLEPASVSHFFDVDDLGFHLVTLWVEDEFGNISSCSGTLQVQFFDSVDEQNMVNTRVNVFPNPAKELVHFEILDETIRTGQVKLYDALGRLVQENSFEQSLFTIAPNNLQAGIYFYMLEVEGNPYNKGKLILR